MQDILIDHNVSCMSLKSDENDRISIRGGSYVNIIHFTDFCHMCLYCPFYAMHQCVLNVISINFKINLLNILRGSMHKNVTSDYTKYVNNKNRAATDDYFGSSLIGCFF